MGLCHEPAFESLKQTYGIIVCMCMANSIKFSFNVGHGPFSHMFEYGVYEQLKLEHPKEFIKKVNVHVH